jgi:hypothetical protein
MMSVTLLSIHSVVLLHLDLRECSLYYLLEELVLGAWSLELGGTSIR